MKWITCPNPDCGEFIDPFLRLDLCPVCEFALFERNGTKDTKITDEWYKSFYRDHRDVRDPEQLGERILHATENRPDVSTASEAYDKLNELGLMGTYGEEDL